MDFYAILGCTPKASPEELRKAWRKLCMEHHPDKGGDEEKFVEVTHAYRMLTDPAYARLQRTQPIKDLTFNIQMTATFEEAFFGTRLVVSYNRITLNPNLEPMKTDEIEPITFSFGLPPGSHSGFQHVEKNAGKKCGKQIGNALVTVNSERHPRYTVKGMDVFVEEKVPLETILKGGYITVKTMWGLRTTWVPPGTLPGTKVRVIGCGVSTKGHQYCSVSVVYPDEKDLKNKSTWQGLDINWAKADQHNKEDEELFKKFEEMK